VQTVGRRKEEKKRGKYEKKKKDGMQEEGHPRKENRQKFDNE
jgi:hypothetical protein